MTPEGSALELEFTSPAHQSLSQDIPVVCVCLYREVFKLLSKGDTRFGFSRLIIGVRIMCQFSINERRKPAKPITPFTRDFSRALSMLHVIARNSDWFIALSSLVVIGRSYFFGNSFSIVIWKPL